MTHLLAPDEPPPFELINESGAGAWFVTCDHASNRMPRALGTLGLPEWELARHIGWDIGAAAVTRGLCARLDATVILQNYSRLAIDCNRRPGLPSSIPVRSENTDVPGNIGISEADADQRRREIFEPYHAEITRVLDSCAAAGRAAMRRFCVVKNLAFGPATCFYYSPGCAYGGIGRHATLRW